MFLLLCFLSLLLLLLLLLKIEFFILMQMFQLTKYSGGQINWYPRFNGAHRESVEKLMFASHSLAFLYIYSCLCFLLKSILYSCFLYLIFCLFLDWLLSIVIFLLSINLLHWRSELSRLLTRQMAWEAVVRVRCSQGKQFLVVCGKVCDVFFQAPLFRVIMEISPCETQIYWFFV